MRIKWTNLFVFSLVVLFFVLLVKAGPEVGEFLGAMGRIGPGNTTEEQVTGLVALGMVGVVLVALTRILTRNHQ